MKHCYLLLLLNTISSVSCDYNNLPPNYNPAKNIIDCTKVIDDPCEDMLVVEALESMTFYQHKKRQRNYQGFRAYFDKADSEFKILRSKHVIDEEVPDKSELDDPIITDGHFRPIFTINGQMPGPTIIARENQTLRITVYNELKNNEGLAIHWHGMHQNAKSEMDGVPYISHSPFLPNQYMIYEFRVYPAGTHWYHAHSGTQRTDGIYGALIVQDTLPEFNIDDANEHTLMLMDWSKESSHAIGQQLVSALNFWKEPVEDGISYLPTKGPDGTTVGPFPFWSGLINKRGRHCDYNITTNSCTYNLPTDQLSHFSVSSNSIYRFRLIGVQAVYAFKFSIQDHLLTVVATDGNIIKPIKEVHYVIVNAGERYDVLVNTSNHEIKDYWILAETLETLQPNTSEYETEEFYIPISEHKAEAVLHYQNTEIKVIEPSETWTCTTESKCHVVNCPFSESDKTNQKINYACTNVHQFENGLDESVSSSIHNVSETFFYNFDFDGEMSTNASSVDGINFRFPSDSPVTAYEKFRAKSQKYICPGRGCLHRLESNLKHEDILKLDDDDKNIPFCACTHQVDLSGIPTGAVVEMVITNININVDERLTRGSSHPVHLHGHSFYVVKIGYPNYDDGTISSFNEDVACFGKDDIAGTCETFSTVKVQDSTNYIQRIGWRDESLQSNQVNNKSFPKKDTLAVPYGGYIVIRFVVDNPGWWFLHCHIEIHQLEGMAVVIQELPNELRQSNGVVAKLSPFMISISIFLHITLN